MQDEEYEDVAAEYQRNYGQVDETQKFTFVQWINIDDDILLRLETFLRGYAIIEQYDEQNRLIGYKIIKPTKAQAEPVCNEEGIKQIVQYVGMHLNKNVRMSNVSRAEVYRDIRSAAINFISFLFENWREWDMKPRYFDQIVHMVVYSIWFSYNRAKDEGERKQAMAQLQERIEKQQIMKADQPKDFFSKFFNK